MNDLSDPFSRIASHKGVVQYCTREFILEENI